MRKVLLTVACLLIVDTILVRTVTHPNLGVYLPLCLGLPLLVIGIFYEPCLRLFSHGLGRVFKWMLICGYALFLTGFAVLCPFLENAARKQPDPGAQAVIVLGAGLRDGRPGVALRNRLDVALGYCLENPQTLLVVSGGLGDDSSITEAAAMARYLEEKGMDPSRILKEEASTSTLENLTYSASLLRERCGELGHVVIATSDYHVYRALLSAQNCGLQAQGLAASSAWYLKPNFCLREYAALVLYRIRGVC